MEPSESLNTTMLRSQPKFRLLAILMVLGLSLSFTCDWGFYAHREINELAIYTLPPEMFGFYKDNLNFLREHAVDPDKRRYSVIGEAPRHFIDIDYYCKGDSTCNPFDLMPRRWNDAVEKYTEDTLQEYGIVPWHINTMVYRLTEAFKDNNTKRVLRLSAELGHYVGDSHVPLHTTLNYNGQMTGQRGIHGFWESRLPELFDGNYDFFVGKGRYVESPLDLAWETVEASHNALDSVLRFEAELNDEWPSDQKYVHTERGRSVIKTYSEEYSKEYHRRLNGQVERRMKTAVITLGSLWYTAWVNAGQPVLSNALTPAELDALEDELNSETSGESRPNLQDREHGN
jgi:hypothetical protein